jgi:hypothetical protein
VKDSCRQSLPQLELVPEAHKTRPDDSHWVRCPHWQKLEASV